MCGISGVAATRPLPVDEPLEACRDTLQHRGPDDAGAWWSADRLVGLAHRRLAVIDLTPGGHQPMADASGQLHVVFNGEIYNYRELRDELRAGGCQFHTESDTEVLLAAFETWGTDCVSRLNGMFAFAIYDARSRHLFLARDRAGEKPLFFYHAAGELRFASELKALLASDRVPRVLDVDAFEQYMAYGFVPGDMCILAGVHKLPPAHAMSYSVATGELRRWRYWQLPPAFDGPAPSIDALTDELDALLADSVRLQRVADVPVGVLLSGGLDSSLITAMAARASSRPVKTFTVVFPGAASVNEGPYAQLVASHFGTEHTELEAEAASVDLLPELARQYDEPLADSSMVPTFLVCRLIRRSATVALGGDGGDELFGGYNSYSWMMRQFRLRRYLPPGLGHVVSGPARLLPVGFPGRTYLLALALAQPLGIAHANLFFDSRTRQRLSPLLRGRAQMIPEMARVAAARGTSGVLEQMTTSDFATYLPDDILVKVDRASMLASLEVRAPFLDHRIVSFAFGRVPTALRATELGRKILLRNLGRRLLPPALDLRRKQGFGIPLGQWLKGEWGTFMEEVLRDADPCVFDPKAVAALFQAQRRGLRNPQRLFALTMFELWRREYGVSLPD